MLEKIVLTPVLSQTLHLTIPVLYNVGSTVCVGKLKQVERAISHNLVLNLASGEKDMKTCRFLNKRRAFWLYTTRILSVIFHHFCNSYHKYSMGTALPSVSNCFWGVLQQLRSTRGLHSKGVRQVSRISTICRWMQSLKCKLLIIVMSFVLLHTFLQCQ